MSEYRTMEAKGGNTEAIRPKPRAPKAANPNQIVQRLDAETVLSLAERYAPGIR